MNKYAYTDSEQPVAKAHWLQFRALRCSRWIHCHRLTIGDGNVPFYDPLGFHLIHKPKDLCCLYLQLFMLNCLFFLTFS